MSLDLSAVCRRTSGGIRQAMPNLSAYCAEGVRFTDAYVTANVSSPSRAGLLTSSYFQGMVPADEKA